MRCKYSTKPSLAVGACNDFLGHFYAFTAVMFAVLVHASV